MSQQGDLNDHINKQPFPTSSQWEVQLVGSIVRSESGRKLWSGYLFSWSLLMGRWLDTSLWQRPQVLWSCLLHTVFLCVSLSPCSWPFRPGLVTAPLCYLLGTVHASSLFALFKPCPPLFNVPLLKNSSQWVNLSVPALSHLELDDTNRWIWVPVLSLIIHIVLSHVLTYKIGHW